MAVRPANFLYTHKQVMKPNRQWYADRKTNCNARMKTIYLYAKLRGGVCQVLEIYNTRAMK